PLLADFFVLSPFILFPFPPLFNWRVVLLFLFHYSVVHVRIKLFSNCFYWCNTLRFKYLQELIIYHFYSVIKTFILFCNLRLHCTFKVINNRKHLYCKIFCFIFTSSTFFLSSSFFIIIKLSL